MTPTRGSSDRRRSAGSLEHAVLSVLRASDSSLTPGEVQQALNADLAYTTVMTMMKILEQKGHLKKTAEDKAHLYKPTRPKKQVVHTMVRDFIERVFNGSAEPLVMHLLEEKHLSEDEIREIERMLKQRRQP